MIFLMIDFIFKTYFNINTYFILFLSSKKSLYEIIVCGLFLDLVIFHTWHITIIFLVSYFIYKYLFKKSKSFLSRFIHGVITYFLFLNTSISLKSFCVFLINFLIMYFWELIFIKFSRE